MNPTYTAVIKEETGWWIGLIGEVSGVNCQENSREELLENLKVTLKEALAFNRQEALGSCGVKFRRTAHWVMKREELVHHLRAQCELLREGGRHSWGQNSTLNKRSAVPRHKEIKDQLAEKI
jgi:predicted RNase H-like HicB family nuclease